MTDNDENPVVSVCMATYNGAEFISAQMSSILEQLGPGDEVIVVDDASSDRTLDVIRSFGDARITVFPSTVNRGYVSAFERAITESKGRYILLSDQDDVWMSGRVDSMIAALRDNWFVASNFSVFGGTPNRLHRILLRERDSKRWLANLFATWVGYRPYYGCTMAFRAEAKPLILPFPTYLAETHDQWIAMVANLHRKMYHLEKLTVARRLHDLNTTPKGMRPLKVIIAARIMLVRALASAWVRKSRAA